MYLFWNYIYDVRPWTVVYFIENVRLDKPGNGCGFLIDFAVRLWTSPWSKGYRTATPLTSAVGAQRKHVPVPKEFRSPPENGRSA